MYINKISVYQNNIQGRKFPAKKKQEISFQGIKGALAGSVVGYIMSLGVLGLTNTKPENSAIPMVASMAVGGCCGSKLEDKNNDDDDNNDNGFNKRMRRI